MIVVTSEVVVSCAVTIVRVDFAHKSGCCYLKRPKLWFLTCAIGVHGLRPIPMSLVARQRLDLVATILQTNSARLVPADALG